MNLLERYLPRTEFQSYEDFKENFKIVPPPQFDFARDIVDAWAAAEPNKQALLYCADEGESLSFTFSDISTLSKRAATWFLNIGIQKGDRVLTLLRRRWEYWIIATALARIGATLVPASVQMKEKDLLYRIQAANVKLLLSIDDETLLSQISGLKEKCPELLDIVLVGNGRMAPYRSFNEEFTACPCLETPSTAKNSDEMLVYFTSGTSGLPKMAVHNRLYPLGHIVTAKYMQCVQNNGLHIAQVDSGWAKFGWGNIYAQWIAGTAILAYDPVRFDTFGMLRIMEQYQPTTMCVPVTMYRFLLRDGLSKKHVKRATWFSTAGEPLSDRVNNSFYEITGHYIHEAFGQSEGTPITCGFPWLPVRPASMGKPSPLYDVSIVRTDGCPCKTGEVGEVVIHVKDKGQLGLLDYYSVGGEILNPVINGIYHTGDTAYQDEDGYYWYVGRVDDMIKCSGYRIGPFEIESVLNAHPAVKESAIIGAPDPIRGQVVCAVISLSDKYCPSESLTRELQQHVKENTAPYKYPRKIIYIDDLPKTTSGKIIRRQAKEYLQMESSDPVFKKQPC